MTYLYPLFAPTFAVAFLFAIPALTFALMRRAGIRGTKLALAALPPIMMFLGGFVFLWLMTLGWATDYLLYLAFAKSVGVSIGAISPLLILAMVKWPVLDNSRTQVETFE